MRRRIGNVARFSYAKYVMSWVGIYPITRESGDSLFESTLRYFPTNSFLLMSSSISRTSLWETRRSIWMVSCFYKWRYLSTARYWVCSAYNV